ncbi:hypothetical protein SKAU_G00133460 [Synaphobranchus kaupii]|uniref:Uncharacterized protein n=1 Tax=Synaphobranchus kaupii TaxID=118154 RepID=A0A9Q1FRL2_SYNKA|nr:hypothetical protein SKAU_G00133460 [Synaphobranchus kaupii]
MAFFFLRRSEDVELKREKGGREVWVSSRQRKTMRSWHCRSTVPGGLECHMVPLCGANRGEHRLPSRVATFSAVAAPAKAFRASSHPVLPGPPQSRIKPSSFRWRETASFRSLHMGTDGTKCSTGRGHLSLHPSFSWRRRDQTPLDGSCRAPLDTRLS